MTSELSTGQKRRQLLAELFPSGVPRLWCPPLTHYDRGGQIDCARIAAHLHHLAPHVKSILMPGSTGDGWELSGEETRQLVEVAFGLARDLKLHLLIGVLHAQASEALANLRDIAQRIQRNTQAPCSVTRHSPLVTPPVCGFAVCPPRGEAVSQQEIGGALSSILELGLPTALYQLPQVTQNEIGPELASSLAKRYANFILFKDSSGADRVVLSGLSLEGVFTMRGAEGDYMRWLNSAGGSYHGFLLSTANCFAKELSEMIEHAAAGRLEAARAISERLSAVVKEVFGFVTGLAEGNPFANANKALDHFFAYGPRAASAPPPRLHAGGRLAQEIISATGEVLGRYGLMPAKGYLE